MEKKGGRRKQSQSNSFEKLRLKQCKICGSKDLHSFLSLGSMPIPNGFLTKKELKKPEAHYPLGTYFCQSCGLVQLTHVVPPEIMFKNYLYIPSTSTTMLQHFKELASESVEKFKLSSKNLIIDIGSNDGTLLNFFQEDEMKVLGIDPASNLVKIAQLKGVETIDDFFTTKLAKKILKEKGKAKVVTATNVVAHINDLHDLCQGISLLLEKEGVFIAEFPYLPDLLSKNEFDTIYHEHLSYFAIRPLIKLFEKHQLRLFDIKRIPVHGGSIRIYVSHDKSRYKKSKTVKEFLEQEWLKKLHTKEPYDDFGRRVEVIKRDLLDLLKRLRTQGKTIVGHGAAAKGNVLLNYCGIGTDLIDYIVDSIPFKQGRYTPGNHIPIYPEKRLEKEVPDYTLLLAWNFADEILKKQIHYRMKGGQYIITIPYLRIE
jgi:SAM-dependent methyltransferase